MSTLSTTLRRQLENAVKQARMIAEGGARKALEALAVHEPDPYRHMDEAQRDLRRKLRAQAKQLGDGESRTKRGAYEITHLVEKLAYDQWHRLLFARFLLETTLLISPEHGVAVSLDDCEELAPLLGLKDAWAVAARFAAKELPEIFRADDPAGAVDLPVEDRNPLIQLVTGLPVEVFTASDSLGWCYQFWQADRKKRINKSEVPVGADELPPVTQLFTEDYMVDFLLDNTLGAWHAGKVLAVNPKLAQNAKSEEELREAIALPGCPWKYLRFIQSKDGKWTTAAGTFDGWSKTAKELKCLDPCMGSGHFVVAMFERLVALRMTEEKLDEAAAVAAVIHDNLFGLEIESRCTQIGAFNLALAAWRRVGHCKLPAMHIACSGLAPNAKKDDWVKLAGGNVNLRFAMGALYNLFQKAPILGSLINPRQDKAVTYATTMQELQPLLETAMSQEKADETHEMAVTASGLAKAAEILAGQFTLIATNVPFLARGKQCEMLKDFCEEQYPNSMGDLSAVFVERLKEFCLDRCTIAFVSPEQWFFTQTYIHFREVLLRTTEWCLVAKLGPAAFQIMNWWAARTILLVATNMLPEENHKIGVADLPYSKDTEDKPLQLLNTPLGWFGQLEQLKNPDGRVKLSEFGELDLLNDFADFHAGIQTGDLPKYVRGFFEFPRKLDQWEYQLRTVNEADPFAGRTLMLFWDHGKALADEPQAVIRGTKALGKRGVCINRTASLAPTLYLGEMFDQNGAVIIPRENSHLRALWCLVSSDEYAPAVRELDNNTGVTPATLTKIPFDLAHWQKVAAEKYPHGLPKPFSSDPTQWLFNGHPKGSDWPLHVAVARLLGYQWPRQTGSSFPDCPALGPDGSEELADDDGIVCLSATKGEGQAAERLRDLLARSLGKDWNATVLEGLLAQADYAGKTLDDWLWNGFFEQHCALFHHRPFIWHIWDGHKSGFSALVNYHKLTHANLEKLTYAYLGDWIRRQQAAVDADEAGSDARLQAAKQLQSRLKLILEGEPPYDLFVRWKPLSKQAIGWHPDINDGVRLNIRPFAVGDVLRKRVKIKWEKDRGKEPVRDKRDFPWFWGWDEEKHDFEGVGKEPDGNRWNDCHYTNEHKQRARK